MWALKNFGPCSKAGLLIYFSLHSSRHVVSHVCPELPRLEKMRFHDITPLRKHSLRPSHSYISVPIYFHGIFVLFKISSTEYSDSHNLKTHQSICISRKPLNLSTTRLNTSVLVLYIYKLLLLFRRTLF